MRIFGISDIHLEFYKTAQKCFKHLSNRLPSADILILAGDIGYPQGNIHNQNYRDLLKMFKQKYEYVLLILGNHEYYSSINYNNFQTLEILQQICDDVGVILLHRKCITIDGIKFIGTTLWSAIDTQAVSGLSDFQYVFKNKIEYLNEFITDFKWLQNELNADIDCSKVVITHHLPSNILIHPKFKESKCNSAFATDILDLLTMKNIKYWFCGHTHEYVKSNYGNTILIANPYGYPSEHHTRVTKLSSEVFEL